MTFSHKRNKKLQEVNLQYKRLYWPEKQRWVRLRVSARVRPRRWRRALALSQPCSWLCPASALRVWGALPLLGARSSRK